MIQRGFCKTKDQAVHLREYGVPEKDIWLAGRGAESLDGCLATFRGRSGVLIVANDLSILGKSRRDIAAIMGRLETLRIRVVDISHPEDDTVAALMQRAANAVCRTRFRDRRAVRRMGRNGGLARGVSQAERRQEIAADWVIRNIVAAPYITWEDKVRLLGGKISESTLRRHFRHA